MKTLTKLLGCTLIHLLFFQFAAAQNLVLNGDFESYNACPDDYEEIYFADHWQNPTTTTPDYYNSCAGPTGNFSVPLNIEGYQFAHSGHAYAAVIPYVNDFIWNEFILGDLSSPLVAGQCYHFEMYMNLSNKSQYTSDDIGVYFSQNIVSSNDNGPLNFTPVVINTQGVFPDTTNWTLVSGDFTAAGGEQHITIGNFNSHSNTTSVLVNPGGTSPYAYFYIDDISVTACNHTCSVSSNTNVSICAANFPYNWNGNNYHEAGIYSISYLTSSGCDSTATLNLQVATPLSSITNVNICSSELPYVWNDYVYDISGTYTVMLVNDSGCDSTATLNLQVNPAATSTTILHICNNLFPYIWNGNTYNIPGTYNVSFNTGTTCDSIATLILYASYPSSSMSIEAVCASQLPYLWNGITCNTEAIYTVTLTNAAGCDSVATLSLIVLQSYSTTNVSLCTTALPYSWNGNSYNAPGVYTAVLTAANGCDSIATLNLSVQTSASSTTNVSLCTTAFPYSWNGNSYSAPGVYTALLTATNGCDSIATLNLNVLAPGSSTTNVGLCASAFPYSWNGNSYNTQGVYTALLTASNGCDSIATLNLVLQPAVNSLNNVSICSSQLPYIWNGQPYSVPGNYSAVLTAANGCDSISTINLVINPIPQVNLGNDTTICIGKILLLDIGVPGGSYLWQDGSTNSMYEVSNEGVFSVRLSQNGCSNADTLMVDFEDCDCKLFIPNAITPNGDGINDQWVIAHQYCRAVIVVSVYNRYGSVVYHSGNYQNDWKGTYGTKNCPDGTYYYVIKLMYPGQKEKIINGNITILR